MQGLQKLYNPSINMSLKHLRTGDTNPPVNTDVLRLYSSLYCPWAQRARLVLAAKGIEFETVNCNLEKKPEFLLERNPAGKVPVLEYHGNVIIESLVISDLIDDLFPEKRLTAQDPFQKAKGRLVIEKCEPVRRSYYGFIRNPDDAPTVEKLKEALADFEVVCKEQNSSFFGGDQFGMTDLMIWPWLERLSAVGQDGLMSHVPQLSAYIERMNAVPAVAKCKTDPDVHRKIFESFLTGNINFDIEYAY